MTIQGTGSIRLHEADCSGTESQLADCSVRINSARICEHNQDAGVRCPRRGGVYIYKLLALGHIDGGRGELARVGHKGYKMIVLFDRLSLCLITPTQAICTSF